MNKKLVAGVIGGCVAGAGIVYLLLKRKTTEVDYCKLNASDRYFDPTPGSIFQDSTLKLRWVGDNINGQVFSPGQEVDVTVSYELLENTCPACVTFTNILGNWEGARWVHLNCRSYLLGEPRQITETFKIKMPDKPGKYKARWFMGLWYWPIECYNCEPCRIPECWTEFNFEVR